MLNLDSEAMLTTDASLSKPKTQAERQQLQKLQRKILRSMAKSDPEWLKNHIDDFINRNIGSWTTGLNSISRQL